jgi:hypothetical protein
MSLRTLSGQARGVANDGEESLETGRRRAADHEAGVKRNLLLG